MSSVLSLQIAHALFPSFFNSINSPDAISRSRSNSNSSSDAVIPAIAVQPAEDMELRPLLSALKNDRTPRHRRTSSSGSYSSTSSGASTPDKRRSWADDTPAAFPHVGFAMSPR